MIRIRATLIKTVSDDGIAELSGVEPGKIYHVELSSIRVLAWSKKDDPSVMINRFSIFVYDCPDCLAGSWMPLEFLKLEAD